MKLAVIFVGLLIGSLTLYLLAAWAQRRGWVNFKAASSGMTAGMAEAGRVFDPPTKYIQTAREEKPHRDDDGDPDVFTPPASMGGG